jgi:hypothetical protein
MDEPSSQEIAIASDAISVYTGACPSFVAAMRRANAAGKSAEVALQDAHDEWTRRFGLPPLVDSDGFHAAAIAAGFTQEACSATPSADLLDGIRAWAVAELRKQTPIVVGRREAEVAESMMKQGAGDSGKDAVEQTTRWERLKKRAWNSRVVVTFLAILALVGSLAAFGSGLESLINWVRRFILWLWP